MAETSMIWDGHTVGDAATEAPYEMLQWSKIARLQLMPDIYNQGVIGGTLNSLVVSGISTTSITIDSGAALVYGRLYHNDSPISFNISGATVYWLVGLASDENTQTIRSFARGYYDSIASALSSLVHIAGTKWEIPLAVVLTNSSGVVDEITDSRIFVIRPQTQKYMVVATGGINVTDSTDIINASYGVPMADSHYCIAYGHWLIPPEFYKLMSVKAIVLPAASGNVYSRSYVQYNRVGSANYNTYLASVGFSATPVTINITEALHQVFPTDAQANGGDLFCFSYVRNAVSSLDTINDNVYCVGWLVEYSVFF